MEDCRLDREALQSLEARLGASAVLWRPGAMSAYESGTRYGAGRAACVVRPANAQDVQFVVRWARQNGLRLIPQGANTGLVAAASPDSSGTNVIISLERLRQITELEAQSRTVRVSAGVLLQSLNARLAENGLWFPIDLGANPSIGGMIAANTGGTRFLRYGDVRRNVLGLDIVLADEQATRLDLMQGLRKNNAGPDLKQLFIGTNGVFGIVVGAVLEVQPLPRQRATALLLPRDGSSALELLCLTEAHFGELLSAFELMSRQAMECVFRFREQVRNPFEGSAVPEQAILLELSSTMGASANFDLQALLEDFLTSVLDSAHSPLRDALLGRTEDSWALRHAVSDSLRESGHVIAFDISMPRSQLEPFRSAAAAELGRNWPHLLVCDFGHFGDGGLHFNVVWPYECGVDINAQVVGEIRTCVYRAVVERFQGSFSAEHGVGPYNLDMYRRFTPLPHQRLAGALQGVMNPDRALGAFDFAPQ